MSKQLPTESEFALPPQEILDLYKFTFENELYNKNEAIFDELLEDIQEVKGELYDRNYECAFDDEFKRVAYCIRWSPSRSIAYSNLFSHIEPVRDILQNDDSEQTQKVLCIGGGAGGEYVAMASIFTLSRDFNKLYLKKEKDFDRQEKDDEKREPLGNDTTKLNVQLIDFADWDKVIKRVSTQVEDLWLRKLSPELKVDFLHKDVLKDDLSNLPDLNLITLLFTTNELFSENKSASIRFFQKLNAQCSAGCYLLIVESAGSFSHIQVGTKKFPIQFLIDTLLLGKNKKDGEWDLIDENDSLWYRCGKDLDYPLKIENMRFFYRLYKKK